MAGIARILEVLEASVGLDLVVPEGRRLGLSEGLEEVLEGVLDSARPVAAVDEGVEVLGYPMGVREEGKSVEGLGREGIG